MCVEENQEYDQRDQTFFFTWVPNFKRSAGTTCLASLRTFTSSPARPFKETVSVSDTTTYLKNAEKKAAQRIYEKEN